MLISFGEHAKVVRLEILSKIGEGLQDRESGDRNTD
ncbi:hypothetical protein A2U01_0075921, partial [Trifolium medium]|nr:hypothetical protein [Trifolium medium]